MHVKINAHKGVGLEIKLPGGRAVTVPPGGYLEEHLTGDQVGIVEAVLESQEANLRLGPKEFGGGVQYLENVNDAPVGSKKWGRLVSEGLRKASRAERREHARVLHQFGIGIQEDGVDEGTDGKTAAGKATTTAQAKGSSGKEAAT